MFRRHKKTWKDKVHGFVEHSAEIGDAVNNVTHATTEVGTMVQKELRSAKDEIIGELKKAPVGLGMIGAAPFLAIFALLFLSMAAGYGLSEVMATGWAFLIVGGVYLLLAGIMFLVGKKKVSSVNLVPTHTIEDTKRDAKKIVENVKK